ncbi:AAA family ATPase [Wolbachia endosymbiont of Pentalonia nigronervosa]|uniref:AAA family ATPase n=1 Tax=Wolbachia endosymbiont of Pentalonia nigronervosa TaxID=1301914 RepID=UPI00165FD095|nr:AAA family ATPase [Wolbachia endosymbiont of Pentalonia nigronervosa]MBD0391190.1 AAA family ATPase [Wolbachia endosymbiont of Pentalonia nigronervosa]
MKTKLIYLIGFPGSGKLTIAEELCKIIDAVIVDNNLFNNIIFDIADPCTTDVPDDLWEKILIVRKDLLAILAVCYKKSKHYIFTNELVEGEKHDQEVFNSVVDFSEKTGMKILYVVLHCSKEELEKRIQLQGRHGKITDPEYVKSTEGKKLFVPSGALEIDNSDLSAKEVARKIVEGIEESKKSGVTSIVTSSNRGHEKQR